MPRKFTKVQYGTKAAKFTDSDDAMAFALFKSATLPGLVEVSNKSGLIGQFDRGEVTPEFGHLAELAEKARASFGLAGHA